jgi:flagella basal body P-ring formation protein FlgA
MKYWLTTLALILALPAPASAEPDEETVKAAFIEVVRERAGLSSEAVITVRNLRPSDRSLWVRSKMLLSVVLPPGETGTGSVTARVQVSTGGNGGSAAGSTASLWVMGRVEHHFPSVVATRPIARGTLLSRDDVRLELGSNPRGLGDELLAIGRVAKRMIRPGEFIEAGILRLPIVVKRGDLVNAYVHGKSFQIQTRGEVLSHGAVGDTVRVRVTSTGRTVHGRVTDASSVVVLN